MPSSLVFQDGVEEPTLDKVPCIIKANLTVLTSKVGEIKVDLNILHQDLQNILERRVGM